MVFAIPGVTDYRELIEMVVSDIENRDCMLHSCEKCPLINMLKTFLKTKFEEIEDDDVKFKQWEKEEKKPNQFTITKKMCWRIYRSLQTNRTDLWTPFHCKIAS